MSRNGRPSSPLPGRNCPSRKKRSSPGPRSFGWKHRNPPPPPSGGSLAWHAVAGATEYRVSYGVGHFLLDATTSQTQWQFPGDLAPGTKIRWGVRASDGERTHEFDVLVTFTVSD